MNDENEIIENNQPENKRKMNNDNLGFILKSLIRFIKNLVSMRDEIVEEQTINTIKENMVFKGSAVWILVCSIIVASVGLNSNSVAVIIGAMLISPLMGPIRAIGLAVAINDIPTLKMGLKNFGIMVAVSLITSTIYFLITPISGDTSELLGRIKPHALDILIAFFGGLAGIIASASSNRNAAMTIVPGVAIATALMPPLCTVSYGIATGQWSYSLGAFYLFALNAVFICLSTIVILRLLKFKSVKMVSKERAKRVQQYMALSLLIIIVPSVYVTYTIVKESIFEKNATQFVKEVIKSDNSILVNYELEYGKEVNRILIYPLGTEITEDKEEHWNNQMKNYNLLDVELKIYRYKNSFDINAMTNESVIKYQEKKIKEMETEIFDLTTLIKENPDNEIDINSMDLRLKIHYPGIETYAFAKSFQSKFNQIIDTVYTFNIKWYDSIPENQVQNELSTLPIMLENEMKLAEKGVLKYPVKVIRYK
jgi:uncharacterized hydrophobic protein (TIGR00271 family)